MELQHYTILTDFPVLAVLFDLRVF